MTKAEQIDMALTHLRQMHKETVFARLSLDEGKLRRYLEWHLDAGQFISISPRHIMLGRMDPAFFSDDQTASDVLLYVRQDARGRGYGRSALESFLRWAKERDARLITVGQSTGVQQSDFESIAEASGLVRLGSVWGVC